MIVSLFPSCEWLYPDTPNAPGPAFPQLSAARGGTVSFQILVRGLTPGTEIGLAFSGLPATLFREIPVTANRNTGPVGFTTDDWNTAKAYATREAPFETYDALEPVSGTVRVNSSTEAFYAAIDVPPDAAPGETAVTLTVGDEAFSGTVTVYEAKLENVSFHMTLWFDLVRMATAHGLELWSEAHWEMIRRYGILMRRTHQDTFWVNWETVDISLENGKYVFDFSRAKRFIELYLSLGFTTIEGAPITKRQCFFSNEFWVNKALPQPVPITCEDGYDFLSAFLTAWRDFIRENGWYSILIQHIGDEPVDDCSQPYRVASSIVRKFLPGVPIIEAIETLKIAGAVDIWVPKNAYFQEHREEFESFRAKGDTLWYYTCCYPGGKFANRLLDMPLVRNRMLFWGGYVYRLSGYLHYGFNHWQPGQDVYRETSCPCPNTKWFLPAGDMNIVYPSPDGGALYSSVRLEQTREGMEDCELLRLLAAKDEAKADAIAQKCFRAFDDCDATAAAVAEARRELLELL